MVLGLASGVGLAFLLEGLDNTVRTTEQAQLISGLPSLGMIPLGSRSAREGPNPKRLVIASSKEAVELVTQVRPQSQMAESYRALRTSLLLSNLGAPPKVIMVTSALPQEGKTTTSINCAVVLAQKGVRVLLIDADLRRPSIHKTLGMGPHSGLSNVLTGSTTLEQAITRTAILPNLFVLPAGTPPPNPAELLASSNMRDVLAQLREQYDHIVIDTPPSLSVTDAVVLSPRADAVVLVIRSGQTTKQALRRSRDILMQVNAKVVGVLLNAVDLSSPDYYYYYEYQGQVCQLLPGRDLRPGTMRTNDEAEESSPSNVQAARSRTCSGHINMKIPLHSPARKRLVAGLAVAFALVYVGLAAAEFVASWLGSRIAANQPEESGLARSRQRRLSQSPGTLLRSGGARSRHRRRTLSGGGTAQSAFRPLLVRLGQCLSGSGRHGQPDCRAGTRHPGRLQNSRRRLGGCQSLPGQGENEKALREFRVVMANDTSLAPAAIQFCWRIEPDVDTLLRDVVPPRTTPTSRFLQLCSQAEEQETDGTAKVWDAH